MSNFISALVVGYCIGCWLISIGVILKKHKSMFDEYGTLCTILSAILSPVGIVIVSISDGISYFLRKRKNNEQ